VADKYREQEAISWRTFATCESPFHMFYPCSITLNGVRYSSAGEYMLYKKSGKWNL